MRNTAAVYAALLTTLPFSVFALSGGPSMPEYTAFEEVSATNLVDPSTGNFTYAVPVVEVPGPAGGYPVALSYHSGISHGQEATWVGLGWSLNAGSINRLLKGVPDDYLNNLITTRQRFLASGSSVNVNLGVGPFGLAMRWDGNTGQYMGSSPSLNPLGLLSGEAATVVGSLGLNMSVSPEGMSVGLGTSIGPIGVNLRLYDSESGFSGSLSSRVGLSAGGVSGRSGSSSAAMAAGEGSMSVRNRWVGMTMGYVSFGIGITSWQYRLDESAVDFMCGYLFQDGKGTGFSQRATYAQDMPKPYIKGSGSGRRQRFERTREANKGYREDLRLYPSPDLYYVAGNGLGGMFEPTLEPARTTAETNLPTILDGGPDDEGWNILDGAPTTRVNFRMVGDPGFNILQDNQILAKQAEPITYPYQLGQQEQYATTRIEPIFESVGSSLKNRLKGFVVTNAEGVRYEYLQPVHDLFHVDYVFHHSSSASDNRNSRIMPEKFATSWLLTAVKGADYFPVSHAAGDLTPAEQDYGHWVKFTYTTPEPTSWSAPFTGNMPQERGENHEGKRLYSRSYGHKELVYLRSIETHSHKAVFELDERHDAKFSQNSPVAANLISDPSRSNPENMYKDEVHTVNSLPFVIYSGGGVSQVPAKEVTLVFPGNWVDKCNAWATRTHWEVHGFAPSSGSDLVWRRMCVDLDVSRKYVKNIYGQEEWEHDVQYSGTCEPMTLNSDGDSEAKCNVGHFGDGKTTKHLEIRAAFINWVELERSLYPDPRNVATKDPGVYYRSPKLLKRVDLFNKQDLANPIKTVEFKYNYSLCGSTPNSSADPAQLNTDEGSPFVPGSKAKGKLTLMRVDLLGQKIAGVPGRMKIPSYSFEYQSGGGNPDYGGEMQKDVWGMYSPMANSDHHLTRQRNWTGGPAANGGENVGVCWNLVGIRTPTGAKISLKYKRDSYYLAGLANDPVNPGRQIAVPDLFNALLPFAGIEEKSIDFTQLLKLQHHRQSVPLPSHPNPYQGPTSPGTETNHIPIINPGPNQEEDFVRVNNTGGLVKGDFVLAIWELHHRDNTNPNTAIVGRGIMNFAVVKQVAGNDIYLHPLIQVNANRKFFLYSDYGLYPNQSFEFSYYLAPIKGVGARREFFGGDVAVTELTVNDGLGQSFTTLYDYHAGSLRSDGINDLAGNEGFASGATFGMPALGFDRHYRYWMKDTPTSLRFDLWPRMLSNWGQLDDGVHMGVLTKWLDQTYFADARDGGYYFPAPGISYSRVTVRDYDPANPSGNVGLSEFQFEGLSHRLLNQTTAFDPQDITKNLQYNDWTITATSASRFDIVDDASARKGKLVRALQRAADRTVIQKNENHYSTNVTAYRKLPGQTSETAELDYPLGHLRQSNNFKIGVHSAKTVSYLQRPYVLTRELSQKDGVVNQVDYLGFDARTGGPLVTRKSNSDGTSLVDYRLPAHWYQSHMLETNRLSPLQEERVYLYTDNSAFNRTDLVKVVSASFTDWGPVSRRTPDGPRATSAYFVRGKYGWSVRLGANGYPQTAYVQPTLAAVTNNAQWIGIPELIHVNEYGYPLDKYIRSDNNYATEYTGHAAGLVVGRVANSGFLESAVFTADYDRNQAGYFDKTLGWTKGSLGLCVVNSESPHFGLKSLRLQNGYGPSVVVTVNRNAHPKYLFSVQHRLMSGTLVLALQPRNSSNGNVGARKTLSITSPVGYWSKSEIAVDLSDPQYAGATRLFAEVVATSGNVYMDDFRLHPENSLVSTYYYNPVTQKLLAAVDENSTAKQFRYDYLGRLTTIMNHDGVVVNQAFYQNMENPQ